jgi:hypothetical protein
MAGCALVNGFDATMRSIFRLDLTPNIGVTGNAENVLGGLQWLVAAAALAFEFGMRRKTFQRRFLAALAGQYARAERLAART